MLGAEREIEGELNAITQNLSALYVQGSSSGSNSGSSSSASGSSPQSHDHIPAITAGTITAVPYGSTSSSNADQQPYYHLPESYGYGFNAHSGGQNAPRSQFSKQYTTQGNQYRG